MSVKTQLRKMLKQAKNMISSLNILKKEVEDYGKSLIQEAVEETAEELLGTRNIEGIDTEPSAGDKPREVIFDMSRISTPESHKQELHGEFSVIIRNEQQDISKMYRAVDVMKHEALELTPRDTGRLQSAIRTGVEIRGDEIFGMVWYDIEAVVRDGKQGLIKYALPVHDRFANHDTGNNPPRATWRFLELAFDNEAIRQQIREILK